MNSITPRGGAPTISGPLKYRAGWISERNPLDAAYT